MLAIDRSRTMAGTPLAATVTAVSGLLDRLGPEDRLGLLLYNGKVILPAPLAPVRGGSWFRRVLGQFEPRGEANLSEALERGIAECRKESCGDLVVISAGHPTRGLRRTEQLERIAGSARPAVRISTIAFGDAAGRRLLDRVAAAGGGSSAIADDARSAERALLGIVAGSSHDQ